MALERYRRAVKIVYGDPFQTLGTGPLNPFTITNIDDNGLRVVFEFNRSNKGDADRCTLRIYNLPKEFRSTLKEDQEAQWRDRRDIQNNEDDPKQRALRLKRVADAFRVNIFTGYGLDPSFELAFRGDMLDVIPRMKRGGLDVITEFKLGDTLLALRDSYMSHTFGTGATLRNLIEVSKATLGVDSNPTDFVRGLAPNLILTEVANGFAVVGRVGDTLTELIDLFGLQWWIRDGVIYFVPQGATLKDYSIQLTEGIDLLDYTESMQYGDASGRALMTPNIVPGRGLILLDIDGKPLDEKGFRVNNTTVKCDTAGKAWWVDFEASPVDFRIIAPTIEFTGKEFSTRDTLDLLERRFPNE